MRVQRRVVAKLFSLVAALGIALQAHAQVVEFQFTASSEGGFGNFAKFGESINGLISIDYGALPDSVVTLNTGEMATWNDGAFSIDGFSDLGFMAGTTIDGGRTILNILDQPPLTFIQGEIFNTYRDANNNLKTIYFGSGSSNKIGNGFAELNDWDPTTDEVLFVFIAEADSATGSYESASYSVTSFEPVIATEPVPATISIDGVDTGVADLKYQEEMVSNLLNDFAATAKNHGRFVSSVSKLMNALIKAGLLTGEEKEMIMAVAAGSNFGK